MKKLYKVRLKDENNRLKQINAKQAMFLLFFAFCVLFAPKNIFSQQNFWLTNGNVGSHSLFIGTTNEFPLLFKTNNVNRLKIDSLGNFDFYNNNLLNINSISTDTLNVNYVKRMIIDTLFVYHKFKLGPTSLNFEYDRNQIYTGYDQKLYFQSFEDYFNEQLDLSEHHTILNLYGGNVGIGTEEPQKKLHIYHEVESSVTAIASLIPLRRPANPEEVILDDPESLDEIVIENERPGSMRIETQVIGGSNSAWDIQPMANIGFGITSHRLIFRDAINDHSVLTLTGEGNVGIGTLNPLQKLHIHNGNILISSSFGKSSSLLFRNGNTGSSNWGNYGIEYVMPNPIDGTPTGGLNFWRPFGSVGGFQNYVMFISDNGNVGIGTGIPEYKLDICGSLRASEIIVDLLGQCPDYVFEQDYNLMSLDELQHFIKNFKHLPEIPSAKKVEQDGINLAEMNMLLLKKIEELTLYIFDLNERINELEIKPQTNEEIIPCKEIELWCLLSGYVWGENIIRNNEDYQKLIQQRSPHPNCGNYVLPSIDFEKNILIGYYTYVGGCQEPNFSYQILKNLSEYTIEIKIDQLGLCERNNVIEMWCLIPKTENNSNIEFKIVTNIKE